MIGSRFDRNRVEHLFWITWYGWLKTLLIELAGGVFIALCFAYLLAVGIFGSYSEAFNAVLDVIGWTK